MKHKIFVYLQRFFELHSNSVLISYQNKAFLINLIKSIGREVRFLVSTHKAVYIYIAAKNTQKVPGDVAEIGCYQGGSTKLIAEALGRRSFYVFDTFEGNPASTPPDGSTRWCKGDYGNASYESVKKYLRAYPNIHVYKGVFPATGGGAIEDKIFSFVHLHVDLYQSTKDCLEFFYPRMNAGAILISHDYVAHEGVRRAFDEFFSDKPEPLMELGNALVFFTKIWNIKVEP